MHPLVDAVGLRVFTFLAQEVAIIGGDGFQIIRVIRAEGFEAGEGPLRAGPTAADNSVLAEWIGRFGFGAVTGIDLPGEVAGIVDSAPSMCGCRPPKER